MGQATLGPGVMSLSPTLGVEITIKAFKKKKGWKQICHAHKCPKETGIAILISDKVDFRAKNINQGQCGRFYQ